MPQDTFKKIVINTLLILLFISLMFGFAIKSGEEYGKDISDLNDDRINLTGVNNTLRGIESTANSWKDGFTSGGGILKTAGIVVVGFFEIALTMWEVVTSPINLLIQIMNNVLLFPPLVTGVIVFIVIVTMMLGIWRLIKQGD